MICPACAQPMRRYTFAKGHEDPGWKCLWICHACNRGEAEPEPPKPGKGVTGGLFEEESAE